MDARFRIFVLGARANLRAARGALPGGRLWGHPVRWRESESPTNARFAAMLNVANGVAYERGMDMPGWVMLDCALLPSFFVGIEGALGLVAARHRGALRRRWHTGAAAHGRGRRRLLKRLGSLVIQENEKVPLSEFCAVRAVAPGAIVAFSLYSLRPGLATAAKAAGLMLHRALGARRQIGVTQADNAAVKTHRRFGSMRVLQRRVPLHTEGDRSFVYEIRIPSSARLRAVFEGALAVAGR